MSTGAEPGADTRALRCVLPAGDLLGETPLWCERTQSLWWLDIDGGRVQRFHPASGRHDVFGFPQRYVGTLALTQRTGELLLGIDAALYRFDIATGTTTLLCEVEPASLDTRLNDGRCDAQGRFWVGSMDNQLHRPVGSFYRVDADVTVQHQFGDVIVSNTVAFSPHGDTLYVSDTRRYTTWQCTLDAASGTLGPRRIFQDHSATRVRPDGACVDAEGFIWNAHFAAGRVVRYAPDGREDRVVALPTTNPTCVCLGGPELRTLYITTARKFLDRATLLREPLAGSLLAIEVDVSGLPEQRFGQP